LRARETFDAATGVSAEQRKLAYEELLIAEGSDWCWWYGPEHDSANRVEFDQLYRGHLANIYRALGKTPPEELSRPILRVVSGEYHLPPSGPLYATIDGEVSSYFEWLGAGVYRKDERSGAMHASAGLLQELQYGLGRDDFYVRLDFHGGAGADVKGLEIRLTVNDSHVTVRFDQGRAQVAEMKLAATPAGGANAVECAFKKVFEIRLSLAAIPAAPGTPLRFQVSLWQGNLPVDAIPQQGWLEAPPADAAGWAV
jgi:hypothetical protein